MFNEVQVHNKCKCKANDGHLLAMLPPEYQNGYPVDPRYALEKKETHINSTVSRLMDKMMVTHRNGEQLSALLHELHGEHHLDRDNEYYSQAINTKTRISKALPSFEDSIGRYSPSGGDLCDI